MGEYTYGAKVMSKNLKDIGELGRAIVMDHHFSLHGIKTKFAVAVKNPKISKKPEEAAEDIAQPRPS